MDTEVGVIDGIVDQILVDTGTDIPASIAALPTATENADGLLNRTISGGADGGRDVTSALQTLRNRQEIAAGTLTVYAEDDSTPSWTAAVTTAAGNPITEIDPA